MDDLFAEMKAVASRVPGSVATFSRAGYLTHRDFFRNIESAAKRAISLGVRPGQLAVVRSSHQDARLQLTLALMRIGCRVGASHQLDAYQAQEVGIDVLISDDPKATGARRVLPLGPDWFKPNPYVSLPEKAEFSVIFNSSGSTGMGKLMEITEKGLLYRLNNRFNDLHHGPRPRFLCFGGQGTSNSLQDTIVVLLKGGMIIRPLDETPGGILDALQCHNPNYVFATPAMVVNWLDLLKETPAVIERIATLRIGGAYCSPQVRAEALTRFADTLVMSCGSTETGNLASLVYTQAEQANEVAGKVRGDVAVKTVDDEGRDLPVGAPGHLRIKVPDGIMATYLGRSRAAAEPIRDGWYVTGDIGSIDADRNLRIIGRANQIINTGGIMVSPEAVEAAIAQYGKVKAVGVAGIENAAGFQDVHAAIVCREPIELYKLNQYLHQKGDRLGVHVVKLVESVPMTENGKVDRRALKKLLQG